MQVTVLIGDPIEFDDLLNTEGTELASRENLYDAVSTRIGQRLKELKLQVDKLALEKPLRVKEYALQGIDRAAGMLQEVDWELFGMNSYISAQNDSEKSTLDGQNKEVILSNQESISGHYSKSRFTDFSIMAKVQSFMKSTEYIGYAARGASLNPFNPTSREYWRVNPVRAWKQRLEASYGATVNFC